MAGRSDSWDAFLCHGSSETFDATIPMSMLSAFPEEVTNATVIPCREFGSTVCPRYQQGKNCNNRTNCLHLDLVCHKWFQGTCEYRNSCCNQHGQTFDSALRSAFNIQLASRGRRPPVQFESAEGGTMRQINRRDVKRIILNIISDNRRGELRRWRFGTHFTCFHRFDQWDVSSDAEGVREAYCRAKDAARLNDLPRARSPRNFRGVSPRRGDSRPPVASWTNRPSTPPRGRSSFFSSCATVDLLHNPRDQHRLPDHSSTSPLLSRPTTESNAPSLGGGAGSSFRSGDAEDKARGTLARRGRALVTGAPHWPW